MVKIFNKQNLKKVEWFFNSYYYPIFMFAVVLLTHCLALDILGLIITVLCFFITTVLCEDLRPSVPFILMFPYVVSTQNSPGYFFKENSYEYYADPVHLGIIAILVLMVIIAFTVRVIIRKEYKTFFSFKGKKLLLGFLLLIPCYALAGLGSAYLDLNSFLISLLMILLQPIIYIIFSSGIHSKEDTLIYISKVATLAIILMSLEIAFVYLFKYSWGTKLDDAWKSNLVIGIILANPAGSFIVMFMPFAFYLAYKEKYGYIYYIVITISLIAVYFTLSRTAMLFAIPTFLIGSIFLCFKGQNKLLYRILSISYIALIILTMVIISSLGKTEDIFSFFINSGIKDRGRFEIWETLFEKFKQSPIFGVGFTSSLQISEHPINELLGGLAHNTPVQIICSTGIIGTLFFLYHIFEVGKVFFTKITSTKITILLSILLFLGASLFEPIFFFPNFTVIYTLLLVFLEKDAIKTV